MRNAISLCLLIVAGSAFAAEPTAAELLQTVRDKYRRLEEYHFVRRVLVEQFTEAASNKVAEMKFETASVKNRGPNAGEDSWKEMQAAGTMPYNYERFRFGAHDRNGGTAMGADGKTRWISSAAAKEYIVHVDGRPVTGPTGGALFAGAMLMPLSKLLNEFMQGPEFVADEVLEFGDVRRNCRVIRGRFKPPPKDISAGVGGDVLMQMQMTGLAPAKDFTGFVAVGTGPSITLWIDAEDGRILQIVSEQPGEKESKLRVTETFEIARLENIPDEVFRFVPSAGAKEVKKFSPLEGRERAP